MLNTYLYSPETPFSFLVYYMIDQLLYHIGSTGPIVLFAISLFLLSSSSTFLIFYVVGSFANVLFNYVLKGIIREPRPNSNLLHIKKLYKKITDFNVYGMPSGHSQSVWFSTCFVFLVTRRIELFVCYAIISLITMWQRVKYRFHTLLQVIVGGVLGVGVAYVFFTHTVGLVKETTSGRRDDNYFGENLSTQYLNFSFW